MSMPSFPTHGADMTREEAITMIIASIAMEELALSHILNAEGEKLQYILGTLPGTSPCACPQDVLAVNKSVTDLVEAVTQNQMLLKNKLSQVLEFCPPPPPPCRPKPTPPYPSDPCDCPCRPDPCEPPCPESHPGLKRTKSVIQLIGQKERMLWGPDCRLPWKLRCSIGDGTCCEGRTPAQIRLDPERSYAVQYTMNVCATSAVEGTILLKQSPCGAFTEVLPLQFSMECGRKTLHHAAVIHPCRNSGCDVELFLVLDAKAPICVERAVMDIVEL